MAVPRSATLTGPVRRHCRRSGSLRHRRAGTLISDNKAHRWNWGRVKRNAGAHKDADGPWKAKYRNIGLSFRVAPCWAIHSPAFDAKRSDEYVPLAFHTGMSSWPRRRRRRRAGASLCCSLPLVGGAYSLRPKVRGGRAETTVREPAVPKSSPPTCRSSPPFITGPPVLVRLVRLGIRPASGSSGSPAWAVAEWVQ